jgi:outer membrane receptor protein involved in Fe transport
VNPRTELRRASAAALLLLVLAASGLAAQATATVSGTLTDSRNGAALHGIVVEVPGTRVVGVSDEAGRFTLGGLAPGAHVIRIRWFGYRDREERLTLAAGETRTLDLALEAEPLKLGEIVVTTASRQPERVMESPAAVATVSPARVRDLVATGQTPLLVAELPGVQVMQSGVNSFNVNVGAFNALVNRRLLVLVDGRDVSVPIVGSQEWPALSLDDYGTRVELVRGPGSALYGANAYAGVLNVLTPSVRQSPGTRLTLAGGELSTLRLAARHAGVSKDLRWGFSVQGDYSRSGSWDRSRTRPADLAEEYRGIVDASRVVPPPPGFEAVPLDPSPLVTAGGSARVERYLTNGGVLTAEGGYAHLAHQVGATGASRTQVGSSDRPWARVAWADERVNVMAYYTARGADQANLSTGQVFEDWSSRVHLEAQTTRRLHGERGRVTVGASLRREVVDSKGTVLAPEHDGRVDEYWALFGHTDLELFHGLKVIAAARFDDATLHDPRFSPKAGLLWMPTREQSLRLTFGQAYLMPSATDRFVRFPLGPPADLTPLETGLRASPLGPLLAGVPAGTLFTRSSSVPALAVGDEKRGPEEVRSLELGYKAQLGRAFVSVDVHRSGFSDFATSLLPGIHPRFAPWTAPASVPQAARDAVEAAVRQAVPGITRLEDGSTGIVYSAGNAGRATQWGVDLSAGLELGRALRLDANYGYVAVDFEEGSFMGGDSIPTNTPTHSGNASLTWSGVDGLRVRLGLNAVAAFDFQSALFAGPVPSRQTVDLGAGYTLSDRTSVTLSVTNLFDQRRYQYFGGSIVGRRALVALTWEP